MYKLNKKPRCIGISVFVLNNFLQGSSQLIGAGGGLEAAGSAFQTGNYLVDIHTFHQGADALQIAVTTADVLNIVKLTILDLKEDPLRASAFCFVFVLHGSVSFLMQ